MYVRHALVKLRLAGHQVERRLAVEYQAVRAGLDINDAGDVLLRDDVIADRLCEPNKPDVDRTGRKAVQLARIERLDCGAAGKCFRVRGDRKSTRLNSS